MANQALPLQHIVVIDDGSNSEEARDSLAELAAEHDDVEFVHQPNSAGSSVAGNLGLDRVRTPITGFLDADDSLRADSLEHGLSYFAQDPEMIGAYTGFSVFGEAASKGGSRFNSSLAAPLDGDGLGKRIPGGVAPLAGKNRSFARRGGFDSQLHIMEDSDLLLRNGRRRGRSQVIMSPHICATYVPIRIAEVRRGSF